MLQEEIVSQHNPGETDDLVMSLVICCRMINYIASFEDDIFEVVNQNLGGDDNFDDNKSIDEYDEPYAQLDYFR